MPAAVLHPNESQRLAALESLNLFETAPEQEFQDIVSLAAQICGVPIALISLVGKEHQWFKAKVGLDASSTGRDCSFCAHAILGSEPFVVADACGDERFIDNTLVTGKPGIRFYAGVPLEDPASGLPVGTLCVIDQKPRQLGTEQLAGLVRLKNQVVRLIEARLQLVQLHATQRDILELSNRQEFILEGAGLGAWDWWLDTNRVHFDSRWCHMLGLDFNSTLHELSTWDSRVHPEDKERAYADIRRHLNGETNVYENIHRLRHQNGDWVWILDRGRVSERDSTGRPTRFTGTHFDITAYKRNEEILSEIQKIAKIGGWELDVESMETRWTDEVYKIYALPLNMPTNKVVGINHYAPHERERIGNLVTACIQGEPYRATFEFFDATGKKKWVEAAGVPVFNAFGKVRKIQGTIQDVTQRVEAQMAVEESRSQAAHAAKLASLGEMSAGVAHEINNPLAVVVGNLPLLEKHRLDAEKFSQKIQTMKKATTRISKIVNGLKKYSRSSVAQDLEWVDLAAVVDEGLLMTEAKAKRHSVEIRSNIAIRPKVLANSIELEQVVVNLINNAIDACQSLESRWIQVTLTVEERGLVIEVLDSGSGISEDVERKMFEPFFTTKPVGSGTGLGLSICRGILETYGAVLQLNRAKQNTCFEVVFPVDNRVEQPKL